MSLNLKTKRISQGKKQKDVAKRVGITPHYLCIIERDNSKRPSSEVMIRLAEELDATVQELFFE